MDPGIVVVLCTAPSGDAEAIAELVVEKRLAACVNLFGVGSVFWWEGEVAREREELMVIKTRRDLLPALTAALKGAHPYDVPEIIALPIIDGDADYLAWVAGETRREERSGERHPPECP
ncbi:periplasmic divalent cation tolerance protein [Methanofollis sp. W23]|uniref:divalent-cation tolerance protein CutA n=1 Tax=Methanofollis sp. W23 TaxID=2817849 RepID=UPI001AE589DE|nr:divalent-cation tolerance protein CutA [Methanofollis sp. W23]MBP2145370.1 periplasmic divalent cation tolerance protein [Methanofollis sp. W23]